MHAYLIHYNGKGRLIELDTRATSADDFGRIQRDFATAAGAKDGDWPYADMERLYPDQCIAGIHYGMELAGPGGASYELYILPNTDREAIRRAKTTIRRDGDVVSLRTLRIDSLI